MTTAAEILKLIETVDPDDTAKLDEIDAAVAKYLGSTVMYFGDSAGNQEWVTVEYNIYGVVTDYEAVKRYTRSRDMLKAIRPEGWLVTIGQYPTWGKDQWYSKLEHITDKFIDVPNKAMNGQSLYKTGYAGTEELAELHALIQAIAYERGQE
ncbi:hypothetical protein GCM10027347_59580 [Larkinella harenae]